MDVGQIAAQHVAAFAVARRVASPGGQARRTQLVKRIRSLRSRFVAASASGNGNGNGSGTAGDLSSGSTLKRIEADLEMLAEAEAAAEAALRKLEENNRSLLDTSFEEDIDFKSLRAENSGSSPPRRPSPSRQSDPFTRQDVGGSGKAPLTPDKLGSALSSVSADIGGTAGLEFSLEEIEEQLKAKVSGLRRLGLALLSAVQLARHALLFRQSCGFLGRQGCELRAPDVKHP